MKTKIQWILISLFLIAGAQKRTHGGELDTTQGNSDSKNKDCLNFKKVKIDNDRASSPSLLTKSLENNNLNMEEIEFSSFQKFGSFRERERERERESEREVISHPSQKTVCNSPAILGMNIPQNKKERQLLKRMTNIFSVSEGIEREFFEEGTSEEETSFFFWEEDKNPRDFFSEGIEGKSFEEEIGPFLFEDFSTSNIVSLSPAFKVYAGQFFQESSDLSQNKKVFSFFEKEKKKWLQSLEGIYQEIKDGKFFLERKKKEEETDLDDLLGNLIACFLERTLNLFQEAPQKRALGIFSSKLKKDLMQKVFGNWIPVTSDSLKKIIDTTLWEKERKDQLKNLLFGKNYCLVWRDKGREKKFKGGQLQEDLKKAAFSLNAWEQNKEIQFYPIFLESQTFYFTYPQSLLSPTLRMKNS